MSDYADGKNVLLKRPEPGRPFYPSIPKQVNQPPIDTNAIANAVIEAITKKMSNIIIREGRQEDVKDTFDNSKSMEKLAEAMTVQRGNSESNFEDLGRVKKTVKNKEEVNKTIDLLKDIGD